MKNNPHSIIIRTSWVYSSYGKNFVRTMMKLMNERSSVSVVNDQHGSPTYAADLALAIMVIISSASHVPGIFHYSNRGETSWYEFALAIRDIMGSDCEVLPISTVQFPTPAKRPAYSVMDTGKITGTYDIEVPDWRASLESCMKKLMAGKG
jgi:dTDP-4-dehydrorhamnose reductase